MVTSTWAKTRTQSTHRQALDKAARSDISHRPRLSFFTHRLPQRTGDLTTVHCNRSGTLGPIKVFVGLRQPRGPMRGRGGGAQRELKPSSPCQSLATGRVQGMHWKVPATVSRTPHSSHKYKACGWSWARKDMLSPKSNLTSASRPTRITTG